MIGCEVGKPIERRQRLIKNFHRGHVPSVESSLILRNLATNLSSYLSALFPSRWYMTPSTVNAYYSPSRNQIGTFCPRVDSQTVCISKIGFCRNKYSAILIFQSSNARFISRFLTGHTELGVTSDNETYTKDRKCN